MALQRLLLLLFLLSLCACSSETGDSAQLKNQGGEELLDVRADYSFCYDTGSYDPTKRQQCEMPLTYKECYEWMSRENGQGDTFFYANFTGGEPTIPGRTANEYYMVVHYDDKTEKTDTSAVFKDDPSEFMHVVKGNCYPNATIEIYNTEDELMGRMSLENSE